MTIRKALESDYTPVLELFDYSDRVHRKEFPQLYKEPSNPSRSVDYYKEIIEKEDDLFLVADQNSHILGFIYCIRETAGHIPIHQPRKFAVIDNLVVRPDHQRKGIGRKLMESAKKWAIEEELDQLELNVFSFNSGAITLYENLGYETVSINMMLDLK